MKKIFLAIVLLALSVGAKAQDFDRYFEDATLRLDYIFAGDFHSQNIYLDQLCRQVRWAGRRTRLSEKFLNGNGQLTMRDHATQQVIYVWTFSTLFQEYMQYDEAKVLPRAFECSYNVPFPKAPVDITITLTDNHQKVVCEMHHNVDPSNILIRRIGDNGIPFHYVWKGKQDGKAASQQGGAASAGSKADTYVKRNYEATPYNPFQGVDITSCVDIAIVAEGYTQAQMGKFYADCQRAVEALFEREPFSSMKDRFNVVAVAAPSQDGGPTVPHRGVWHNTACGTHYDTFYSDRYLTSSDMHTIYDLLSGVPFEHVIVLVNSGNTMVLKDIAKGGAHEASSTRRHLQPATIPPSRRSSSTSSAMPMAVLPTSMPMTTWTSLGTLPTWSLGSPTSPRCTTSRASGPTLFPRRRPSPHPSTRTCPTIAPWTKAMHRPWLA